MSEFLAMLSTTPLAAGNAPYVEAMYERFLEDPASVEPKWREFFAALGGQPGDVPHGPLVEELTRRARVRRAGNPAAGGEVVVPGAGAAAKQGAVSRMIQIYANRGHLIANIDPLGLMERPVPKVLGLDYLGLGEADLDTEFLTGSRNEAIRPRLKLREIIAQLKHIYCDTIGAEFAHVSDETERLWLQERFQVGRVQHRFPVEDKKDILWNLTMAEGLERYLATRYPAQKRFSLEGGDSLIPLLEDLIQTGGWVHGLEDIVIGMAHRGRLSVLINVLGKSPADLFSEFEGNYDLKKLKGSGDVKYHKGFSCDVGTPGGNVHVALAFNPSHLEVVNPVVEGSVRARQERRGDATGDKVMAVLIHGDAAFAGQGVIQETLQLSQTRAFYTGGTVHLIINNQVGFTTNDPRDTRSTLYCSDVAKMIEAPILHVNGDDPEAVVFAARLALEYRMKFHKDVVIDLVCYRRLGHNEADEPAATQPVMYATIRRKPTTRQIYAERLVNEGVIEAADVEAMGERYRRGLDEGKPQAHQVLGLIGNVHTVDWSRYHDIDWNEQLPTGVKPEVLRELGLKATTFPEGFTLHRQGPWTGARRSCWPTPVCWKTATRCACPARTAAAAPSSTGMRCCTTRPTVAAIFRSNTWPPSNPSSWSSTRFSPKKRCWPSRWATAPRTRKAWSSGKRSSATSPTTPRSSSTSSSAPPSPSGAACAAWCCSCPTATTARAPSTRRRVWSATCSSARRRTCRSAIRARPRRCSICCAGRCCAPTASRSS
jgi:2-oxoglutarate dehydrogenase E1 component